MDCMNPAAKGSNEPGLLGHSETRSTRKSKITKALLALLSLLFIVLLGVVIWLGVEVHRIRSDINDLKRSSFSLGGSAQSALVASVGSTAASSAMYLSKNSTSANGYAYSGSLYRSFFLADF